MKQRKLLFLLMGLLCCFSSTLFAQKGEGNGVLRGRISDEAKQTLPGATVYIEETRTGVVSDVNGFYLLPRVPAGRYHVAVSYVGYRTATFEVTVKAGETVEKNIVLKNEAKQLDAVEIGGTFQGYQRAMNYQKNSANLRNVVSADQVGRFPDANIGDAMKRIPGINVQYDQGEARFGQIRGTSPDFSSVTINGNRLPSAESEIRNVQLDLIPADMVQTIVVNKVVTADMDADAIGGSVNLVTKSAPAKRMLNATVGTGWNFISDRPQVTAALTYGDNYFNNKLGMILSASYQNNPIGSDNTEFEWALDDAGNKYITDYQIRQYMVQRERQSYSASLGYRFNLNHRIDFKGIYNRRKDWENRYRLNLKDVDENGGAEKVVYETKGGTPDNKNARLELQQTMDLSLNGEHLFGTTLLNWNLSYARASEDRPNERYISYELEQEEEVEGEKVNIPVEFTPDYSDTRVPYLRAKSPAQMLLGKAAGYCLGDLTEQQEEIREKDFKGSVNFNIPVRIGYESGNLKFGAKVVAKKKTADYEFHEYKPLDEEAFDAASFAALKDWTRTDFYAGDYRVGSFVSNKYLGSLDLNDASLFEKEENLEELAGAFRANETVTSGYIRFDHNITRRLNAMLGIRLENTHVKYRGKKLDIPEDEDAGITLTDTPESTDRYLNVLPSVLFKYDATPNTVLRLSYTNTLARPKYYDLVPRIAINSEDNEAELGNPELKATLSHNVDFSAEYFFPQFGMVSAGVYYKRIKDFIVEQTLRDTEYENHTYDKLKRPVNAGKASLAGVEIAWQRDFGFISPALKYFGLYANYTYTFSRITDFALEREDAEGNALTDERLPMAGSPEHIANVSLYFERKGLNVRLSYNFASDFVDEFGSTPFEDRYYDRVNYLDLNASYSFAKHYTVFAEANNLLNQPLRYYQGTKDVTMQAEYYGPKINIGFKVNF